MTAARPEGTRACQHCEASIREAPNYETGGADWADTDGGRYCLESGTGLRHAPMPVIPPMETA